jgi:hypothetical protein
VPLSDDMWDSPLAYRCDEALAVRSRATLPPGCVVPDFTPTLELSLPQYGAAAALIAWAQQHLTAHWGLAGRGQPLTRLQDEQYVSRNRSSFARGIGRLCLPGRHRVRGCRSRTVAMHFPLLGHTRAEPAWCKGELPGFSCKRSKPMSGGIPRLTSVEGGAYGLFANAQRFLD